MDIFAQVTLLSAGAVLVVEQILKLKVIPITIANEYPVVVNVVLSVAAALVATWQSNFQPKGVSQWLVFVGLISLISAMTYNHLLANSGIKELEG